MKSGGMSVLSLARTVLLGLEFICGIIIWGVAAGKIKDTFVDDLVDIARAAKFAIAWGVIGWIIVTIMLILNIMGYFMTSFLPPMVEAIIQVVLAIVFWMVGGIVTAAKFPDTRLRPLNTVIAFFWINFVLSLASAVVCFLQSRSDGLPAGGNSKEDEV
mmetsp:Transcript_6569/g.19916  ORF Transcript_6569/g.19916 Transcript_6569/m.19916 type:complete len:159 (+) Transcript_6569:79-555(+)|eukprot:CAMPEP_0198725062 /NCGR_PEP_ID=MMETSP1475-20131203/2431_1 /TAXON_ID= ORGANISM="Unidentified sp., Strain CCMP1999" /NCGR_SAMPLE_ID=MMETSP1475 /ASSEMBLY_ACC=CAM_ASM_001111 /LENGTH=158 /DNA_ID=CAMNT_0044486753 /DNA_START=85 /DNA_END=561 /DNA_ORIENTATION=+